MDALCGVTLRAAHIASRRGEAHADIVSAGDVLLLSLWRLGTQEQIRLAMFSQQPGVYGN